MIARLADARPGAFDRGLEVHLVRTQGTRQRAPACKLRALRSLQGETLPFPHVKPRP